MVKIVVDLQGADKKPTELVDGALQAVNESKELFVYLCADKKELEEYLKNKDFPRDRVEIIDAPDAITNSDNPTEVYQTKKNSSLIKGMELCKENSEIGGFASCGATGAIFVSSMMLLGRIAPVSPMLLCELRKKDFSPFCIVDCGANVDCRAEKLCDFARMGVAYMKAMGISEPRVALLSNGAEDKKGNTTVKKANELLRKSNLTFIGNVEGSHILDSKADVVVCEGFAGNVLLKTIEGAAKTVLGQLKELSSSLPSEAREQMAELCSRLYREYDYNAKGGAVLLGVSIPVVKGHGAADKETVYNITMLSYRLAKNDLVSKIKNEFMQV